MSNSVSGLSPTFLIWDVEAVSAQLDALLTPPVTLPNPLNAFTTYFSNIPSPSGVINIPVPAYPSGSFDLSSGMVIADANITNYTLTVNRDAGWFVAFRPGEVQQYGLANCVKSYLLPPIYAIETTLNSASYALAASSVFATASYHPATSTAFSSSAMTNLNSQLSTAGINGERFCALTSTYFWSLIDNLSTKGNVAGALAIQNGSPNNPFNTQTFEAQQLPTVGNLVGLVGTKNAIVVGTAIPQIKHANGDQFVYTSPRGTTVLFEQYYDEANRRDVIGASVIYNAAIVNNSLLRVTSS